MKRVRIVTDSTADIPAVLASELDISVVPCQVHFDGEMYQDGVTLAPQAFFHKLARSSELPRTSQPPISEFVDTYRQIMNGE